MSPGPTTSDVVFATVAIVLGLSMGIAPRETLRLIFGSYVDSVADHRIQMLQALAILMALGILSGVASSLM